MMEACLYECDPSAGLYRRYVTVVANAIAQNLSVKEMMVILATMVALPPSIHYDHIKVSLRYWFCSLDQRYRCFYT